MKSNLTQHPNYPNPFRRLYRQTTQAQLAADVKQHERTNMIHWKWQPRHPNHEHQSRLSIFSINSYLSQHQPAELITDR